MPSNYKCLPASLHLCWMFHTWQSWCSLCSPTTFNGLSSLQLPLYWSLLTCSTKILLRCLRPKETSEEPRMEEWTRFAKPCRTSRCLSTTHSLLTSMTESRKRETLRLRSNTLRLTSESGKTELLNSLQPLLLLWCSPLILERDTPWVFLRPILWWWF